MTMRSGLIEANVSINQTKVAPGVRVDAVLQTVQVLQSSMADAG
jgi:hypothetical protein